MLIFATTVFAFVLYFQLKEFHWKKWFNVLYNKITLTWEKGRKVIIEIWIMEYFKNYVQIECYFNWSVNYINEVRGIRNYILVRLYYNIYHIEILLLGHLLDKVKGMRNFF